MEDYELAIDLARTERDVPDWKPYACNTSLYLEGRVPTLIFTYRINSSAIWLNYRWAYKDNEWIEV